MYSRAEPLLERALTILEAALGKHHPNVAIVLQSLARLGLAQNQRARALLLLTRTFTISELRLRQEALAFCQLMQAYYRHLLAGTPRTSALH